MGNKNFTHRQISTLEEQLMLKAEAYNSPAVLCEKARKAVTELAMGLGSLRERAYAASNHLYGPRWHIEDFPESERKNAKFVQQTLQNAYKPEVSEYDLQRAVDMLRVLEGNLQEIMLWYRLNR